MLIAGGWNPLVVALFRGILTFAFAAIWFAISAKKGELASAHLWFWSTFAGIGVTGAFSFYFMGMDEGSVAIAATLLYSAPVFVCLAAFLSGSEKISIPKALGLLPVVAGVALLTGIYSRAKIGVSVTTVAIGLLSGVSYAAFIFGFRNASAHGSPQSVITIAFAVECLFLLAIVGQEAWGKPLNYADSGLFLLLGLLGGGPSFLLYIIGLKLIQPSLAALSGMAEPITAAFFGFLVLDQFLSTPQLVGAILVIATVTFLNIKYQE